MRSAPNGPTWGEPFGLPALGARDVHVWKGVACHEPDMLDRLRGLLTEEERAMVKLFRKKTVAERAVTVRAMLRFVLGMYCGTDPARLRFVKGRAGKPALFPAAGTPSPEFNLSHAGDCFVIAVAAGFPVGIDIESTERQADIEGIAKRFFTAAEAGALAALHDEKRRDAFFTCWTRKEAYAKGKGLGISIGLASFEVPVLPQETCTVVRSERFHGDEGTWRFYNVPAGAGFVCTLAVPVVPDRVQYYRCDPADFAGRSAGSAPLF